MCFGLLLIVAAVAGYFYLQNYASQKIQLQQDDQLITIERGTSVQRLSQQLEAEQLITNSQLLPLLLRFDPSLRAIKAGTYRLSANMTLRDLLVLLCSGKEAQFTIQFIEGTRAKDWLLTLQAAPYIHHQLTDLSLEQVAEKLGIDGHIEGWFYPDTYHYTAGTTDVAILKRAYQRMDSHLQIAWNGRATGLPYKSAYEMLIMASIIEKETGVDSERGLVSSVFYNRLGIGMKLQTDPTVYYGRSESIQGPLTRDDLREKTPYNTYVIYGLPPTPIAMPGEASLQAAAHPTPSKYLYFVADGYGGHVFTTNLDSHNRAVQEYLRVIRNR